MSYTNTYEPGNRLKICDVCGFTYKVSDLRKGIAEGQKGLDVCPEDLDPVHPRERTPILRPKKPLREAK